MDLALWISDLLTYEHSGKEPDWDALEEALVALRLRVTEQDAQIAALDALDPLQVPLQAMGDLLHELCEDLDQFLESGDFEFLRAALARAHQLLECREEIRRNLDDESKSQRILA